jgi:arylsulfatase
LDNTLLLYLHDNGGCDEAFFEDNQRPPKDVHVMAPDELQTKTLPPMQTRDGQVVRTGPGVMAGPATSFVGYGPGWANVSNTPLRLVKKNAHEGGVATPLIVHWPAGSRGAKEKVVAAPSHLIDLMPTVVQLAGATYPAERAGQKIQPMEGASLAPLITGSAPFDRGGPLFWEHEGHRAVRDGRWKLVAEENKPWELYDMEADRGEMNDLAARHPDRVKQMAAAWQAYAERAKVQPYGAHRLRKRNPDPKRSPDRLTNMKAGAVYPRSDAPALSGAGIAITARIKRTALDGVVVAHGAEANGYALYVQSGRAHFVARRAGQLCRLNIGDPLPTTAEVTLTARVERDGTATLRVNDQATATADFSGPFLETPADGLSVGFDQGNPVGDYPREFRFDGDIAGVDVQVLTPSSSSSSSSSAN